MTKPASGPLENDEDGNPLPVPSGESDLGQLIQLLEYGRLRGFRIGPTVQIGKLTVQIRDLRQREGGADREDTPDPGPWAQYGHTDKT